MEKGAFVKDLADAMEFTGIFYVTQAQLRNTKNDQQYWSFNLVDASGSLVARIWHPYSTQVELVNGVFIKVLKGQCQSYNGQLQATLRKIEFVDSTEQINLNLADFMLSSERSAKSMLEELKEILYQECTWPAWRKFLDTLFADQEIIQALPIWPAAKSIHHAYAGGLLEHSLGVVKNCRYFAHSYDLDNQLLVCGGLIHDIGKIREYTGGLTNDRTDVGHLHTHIALGLEMLLPWLAESGLAKELQDHLKHLLLSHHGSYEFGACALPQTREAFALYYADVSDARMAQCRDLLKNLNDGQNWTSRQITLNNSQIFRPLKSPQITNANNNLIENMPKIPEMPKKSEMPAEVQEFISDINYHDLPEMPEMPENFFEEIPIENYEDAQYLPIEEAMPDLDNLANFAEAEIETVKTKPKTSKKAKSKTETKIDTKAENKSEEKVTEKTADNNLFSLLNLPKG